MDDIIRGSQVQAQSSGFQTDQEKITLAGLIFSGMQAAETKTTGTQADLRFFPV